MISGHDALVLEKKRGILIDLIQLLRQDLEIILLLSFALPDKTYFSKDARVINE